MSNNTAINIGAAVLAVVIVLFVYVSFGRQSVVAPVVPPQTGTSQPPVVGTPFENEYLKVTVPHGWAASEVTQLIQDQEFDKPTGEITKVGDPHPLKTGAVNITKGNYILFINPNASQASGVDGGRFAEIAQGSPSADAVVTEQPSPPCGTEVKTDVTDNLIRHDWFISNAEKKEYCGVPTNDQTVWYFSYVTDTKNGYINYYKPGQTPGYVITMAYNSKDVNALPGKDNAEFVTTLDEMTNILKTLELKSLN